MSFGIEATVSDVSGPLPPPLLRCAGQQWVGDPERRSDGRFTDNCVADYDGTRAACEVRWTAAPTVRSSDVVGGWDDVARWSVCVFYTTNVKLKVSERWYCNV